MTSLQWIITDNMAGWRLDKALATFGAEQDLSRARIQVLLKEGQVQLAGKIIDDGARKVKVGETYTLILPKAKPTHLKPSRVKLNIVFEDDDVIVLDKPAGMVVHPGAGHSEKTLVNALLSHAKGTLSGVGGVERPGIVHRLDKDTSGLMIIAKNDKAHHHLAAQFSDRSLSRTYHALVWGVPTPRKGTISAAIGRHRQNRQKMSVLADIGREAVTHYRVLKSFSDIASLVECSLATGRTHQIRVHMEYLKHPVVGDPVYGKVRGRTAAQSKASPVRQILAAFSRQCLHATEIHFIHPRNDKAVSFRSPYPADIETLLVKLSREIKEL
jgi:23S rRNA pseudouridine1911/1915/1917 synthase